jgi:putative PEP-CTERM system TPR-repeat lipoprotein
MTLPRPPFSLCRTLLHPLLAGAIVLSCSAALAQSNAKASSYYEDALSRYEKKDYPGAIIQLKNALQINPNQLPVQLLLGKVLLRNGEVAGAEVAFDEALRLGVNRAEVAEPLGQAYFAQGKHKLLLESKVLEPSGLPQGVQLQVLLLRAQAHADLGDTSAALRAIDEARAIDRRNVDVWLAEVPIRIFARQFKEAGVAAETGLALAPGSAAALYQTGAVAHVQGNLAGAIAAYDRALQADKQHVEARVARMGIAIDQGRFDDVAKDLDVLQSVNPREPRAAYMRALLAERNGDLAASQAALKQVTEFLDPVPIDFIRYRPQLLMLNGLAHFGLRQGEKAKQYLEAFQRTQRTSPVSKLLARIHMADGNFARAIDVLEPYLKVQPGDGQALTLLANAHMASGRNAKAASLMQDALKAQDSPAHRTTLGLSLIGDGQISNGIAELEAAYRKDSRQTNTAVALVQMYLQTNQARRAVPIAEKLVKTQNKNAFFHNLHGLALAQSADLAGAKSAFERAMALDGKQVQARLNVARVDIATRAYDAATEKLNLLIKENPKFSEAYFELAVIAERKGQLLDAQRQLEKARDAAGANETRWDLALTGFHLRHAQPGQALDAAKSASSKKPDDLQVLLAYSQAQIANGDTVAAKSALVSATRVAEYDPPMQVRIASMQLAANNPPGAMYSLEKALSSRPDFLPALAKMAEVLIVQGEFDKADKQARDVIARQPKLSIGYSLLGDVAMARRQSAAAIDAYRKAHELEASTASLIRLYRALSSQDNAAPALRLAEQWLKKFPTDLSVQKALADGYARTGDYKAARQAYEAALKLNADDAETLNNLANVQVRLKDPGAVKTAEAALASAPGNALIIDTLGWALFNNGQSERALQLLRDARLRQPANPEIRYHLATVLAQTGRKNEAKDELRAALKDRPDFEARAEAEKLLASLE